MMTWSHLYYVFGGLVPRSSLSDIISEAPRACQHVARMVQRFSSGRCVTPQPGCRLRTTGRFMERLRADWADTEGFPPSPRPRRRIDFTNDVRQWPRWPIGRVFSTYVFFIFVLFFHIVASGSGNVPGDCGLVGGEICATPWLQRAASCSSIEDLG